MDIVESKICQFRISQKIAYNNYFSIFRENLRKDCGKKFPQINYVDLCHTFIQIRRKLNVTII